MSMISWLFGWSTEAQKPVTEVIKSMAAPQTYNVDQTELVKVKLSLRPTKTKVYPKKYPARDPCVAEMQRLADAFRKEQKELKRTKASPLPPPPPPSPSPPVIPDELPTPPSSPVRPRTPFPGHENFLDEYKKSLESVLEYRIPTPPPMPPQEKLKRE